jgi:hypothetical protein
VDLPGGAFRDEKRTAAFLAFFLTGRTASFEDMELAADGAEPAQCRSDSGRLLSHGCRKVDSGGAGHRCFSILPQDRSFVARGWGEVQKSEGEIGALHRREAAAG